MSARHVFRALIPVFSLIYLISAGTGCSNALDAVSTETPGTTPPPATSATHAVPATAPPERPSGAGVTVTLPAVTAGNENLPEGLFLLSSGTPGMVTLDLIIQPMNGAGESIIVEGRVEVKLWEITDPFTSQKGSLLQEWKGIEVAAVDYDTLYNEVWLQLPYSGFEPEWGQNGIVEVELAFDEGSISTQKEIKLRKSPDC